MSFMNYIFLKISYSFIDKLCIKQELLIVNSHETIGIQLHNIIFFLDKKVITNK